MRVTVSISRKIGQANFGSEGAMCEVALDLSEQSVSANPASLADEIRRAYALAEQVVGEQLARHQVDVDPRGPRPVIEPDRDRLPSQARPPSAPEPDRQPARQSGGYDPKIGPDGGPRWKTDGFPKCGRELVPWARKREESGACPGLFKRLCAFGRAVGYADRVTEWSGSEVSAAVHAVLGGADQYDDEPEPSVIPAGHNGHNGYHSNGNGNGRAY